jgi:hypothetical protein
MSEGPTKVLDHRIAALIQRVRDLAAEREDMNSRLESRERENARLRTVLDETVRELRQE